MNPRPIELRRSEPTPLGVVPMTPPVEATLRILLNSVPFLIGAAVVRQPAAGDSIAAQVGRMPWLSDRRLTTLQLPDDSLPANRAVTLDWPVPYQAEWVGVPPRLLISRLVAQDRTVGVLLGTLITREPMTSQAREALDLSCELIAAAVASESAVTGFAAVAAPTELVAVAAEPIADGPQAPAPEPKALDDVERDRIALEEIARALDEAQDARSIGRVLRDAMNAMTTIDSFSISLFHPVRQEVAYRYKVVGTDAESAEISRQAVDDSPGCYAARRDRRWHAYSREIALKAADGLESRAVSVLQFPLVAADEVFGIGTLQVFGDRGFPDNETRLVARVLDVAADRLAAARRAGRFQPSPSPHEPAAAVVLPPAAAAPSSFASQSSTDDVLIEMLRACEAAGLATAFMVGIDPGAGLIRGELVSRSEAARELDYAVGISDSKFMINLSDRYNAIARACREARVVTVPTLHELIRPLRGEEAAHTLERIVGGGRSTIVPIVVSSNVVGALIVGPMAEEASSETVQQVEKIVEDATAQLAELWKAAR